MVVVDIAWPHTATGHAHSCGLRIQMGRTPTGVKSKNGQWLPVKLKDKIREGPVVSHCFFYYYFENWSRTLLFAYIRLLPPSQYISTPRIQIGKIGGGGNDDFALKWMSLGTAPGDTSGERLSPPPPPPPRRAARQAPARRPGGRGGARAGVPRLAGAAKGGGRLE